MLSIGKLENIEYNEKKLKLPITLSLKCNHC